jgi:hypothetical protein
LYFVDRLSARWVGVDTGSITLRVVGRTYIGTRVPNLLQDLQIRIINAATG